VSQSPLEQDPPADAFEAYRRSWSGLNRLLRRGYSWSGHERNCAFLNLGGKGLVNVSAAIGFDAPDDARGMALVDWDGDGDQDVFLTNRTSPRVRFLRNDQETPNLGVTLELRGTRSNRDAIGARVEVTLAGEAPARRIVRAVRAGEGYLSQSSSRLCIGLGSVREKIDEVRVFWPGGEAETFEGVQPPRAWRLTQGRGKAEPLAHPLPRPGHAGEPRPILPDPPAPPARVPLVRPVPLPRLEIRADDGSELALFGLKAGGEGSGTGRTVLMLLFSTTCAPCARELEELARRAAELEAAGIAPLALSVEPDAERARTAAFLRERGWTFPWGTATPAALEVLEALQGILLDRERPLALPSSFLVDAGGALQVLYVGPLSADLVLADAALCEPGGAARFELATPFEGRWMFPGLPDDADFFEPRLLGRGLESLAREFARGRLTVMRSAPADLLQEFGRRSAVAGRLDEAEGYYRRALSIDPRHTGALFDLAVVLHRQERLDEACELYGKLIALEPDNADARFNLGLARFGLGDRIGTERIVRWLRAHGVETAAQLEELLQTGQDGR